MTAGRSTARTAWAAIAGVVIGAALLAGAHDPPPAGSATQPQAPKLVRAATCADGDAGCAPWREPSR